MPSTWYELRRFKNLPRITTFDKLLRGKSFNIAENPKYDEYLRGPASMVYRCFNKNFLWCC